MAYASAVWLLFGLAVLIRAARQRRLGGPSL